VTLRANWTADQTTLRHARPALLRVPGPGGRWKAAETVDQATLGPGLRPSAHTFSTKQRDFAGMSQGEAINQLKLDAREARAKYGGEVEVRRPGHPLFGNKVRVSRPHLVYGATSLDDTSKKALLNAAPEHGVALHFHLP
jgi:hypothetical protein